MLFEKPPEGKAKELYDRLFTTEFDPAGLRAELEAGKYDKETVNIAAIEYVDDCGMNFEYWNMNLDDYYSGETVPGLESSHMVETIRLLLEYGLDPNKVFKVDSEEYNIMHLLHLVFNGFQGADSLYQLLIHGGDPNLVIDNERLIVDPDFDVCYDTVNRSEIPDMVYQAKVHYWLVLTGYGAVHENGKLPVDPANGFDLALLKEHRNYYVGAIRSDRTKEGWDLVVFDKHTNWEVGRL